MAFSTHHQSQLQVSVYIQLRRTSEATGLTRGALCGSRVSGRGDTVSFHHVIFERERRHVGVLKPLGKESVRLSSLVPLQLADLGLAVD